MGVRTPNRGLKAEKFEVLAGVDLICFDCFREAEKDGWSSTMNVSGIICICL